MLTRIHSYDQGVMSALLTAKQFENVFPQVIVNDSQPSNHATLQSFVVAVYVSILFAGRNSDRMPNGRA